MGCPALSTPIVVSVISAFLVSAATFTMVVEEWADLEDPVVVGAIPMIPAFSSTTFRSSGEPYMSRGLAKARSSDRCRLPRRTCFLGVFLFFRGILRDDADDAPLPVLDLLADACCCRIDPTSASKLLHVLRLRPLPIVLVVLAGLSLEVLTGRPSRAHLFSALGGGVHCSLFRGAVILPSSLADGSSMEVLLLEEVPVRLPASAVVDVLLVPGVA
mmetsp:Transcript_682/g.1655  ORF Transcript_682/g.1655 Transcript_682/m.1655 type:complete len:216 (+) Transcript_682:2752-3399(+)